MGAIMTGIAVASVTALVRELDRSTSAVRAITVRNLVTRLASGGHDLPFSRLIFLALLPDDFPRMIQLSLVEVGLSQVPLE